MDSQTDCACDGYRVNLTMHVTATSYDETVALVSAHVSPQASPQNLSAIHLYASDRSTHCNGFCGVYEAAAGT